MSVLQSSQTAPTAFLAQNLEGESGEGSSRADILTFFFLLLPALVISGVLYVAGAYYAAVWIIGVAFVISCFAAPQIGIYSYFMFQALDAAFIQSMQDQFTPAKVLGPFLILPWLVYYSRSRASILVSKKFIVVMVLYGVFGMITSAFAINFEEAIRFSGQILTQCIMIAAAIHILDTRRYVARAMFWTVIGGLIAAFAVVTGGENRTSRSTLGEYANPNTIAITISVACAAIPAAWILTKVRLLHPFFLAAVPIMIIAILMCGTRSAIFGLVFAFTFCVIFARSGNILKRIVASVVLMAILVATFQFAISSGLLGKAARDRLEAFVQDTGGVTQDSRTYIWQMTFKTYLHEPMIGVGYGNSQFANLEYQGWRIDVHNDVLGALVDGGPIALMLLLLGFWMLFRTVNRTRSTNLGIPAMVIVVIPLISGNLHRLIFSKLFWVPITICLIIAEQAERERRRAESLALEPLGNLPQS